MNGYTTKQIDNRWGVWNESKQDWERNRWQDPVTFAHKEMAQGYAFATYCTANGLDINKEYHAYQATLPTIKQGVRR